MCVGFCDTKGGDIDIEKEKKKKKVLQYFYLTILCI